MSKRKFIFILIDAFRSDYISEKNTPFLSFLRKKSIYYKYVNPSIGFCERSYIFTGKKSLDLGFLTAINLSNESPYRHIKYINNLFYVFLKIFNLVFFDKIIRRILWKYTKLIGSPMYPQNIPLNKLHLFALTEDKNKYNELNNYKFKTIFDLAKEKNVTINYDAFTSLNYDINYSEDKRIKILLDTIEDYDMFLLYVDEADKIGHSFGPHSKEIRNTCSNIDRKINNIYNYLEKNIKNFEILIVGDHGMEKVNQEYDIISKLEKIFKENNINLNNSIEYFVDSTILRIWIKKNGNLKKIIKILTNDNFLNKKGKFIIPSQNKENQPDLSKYGDIIWWININSIINPSFFSNNKKKSNGMHGYLDSNISKGTAIYYNSKNSNIKTINQIDLNKLFMHFSEYINLNDKN